MFEKTIATLAIFLLAAGLFEAKADEFDNQIDQWANQEQPVVLPLVYMCQRPETWVRAHKLFEELGGKVAIKYLKKHPECVAYMGPVNLTGKVFATFHHEGVIFKIVEVGDPDVRTFYVMLHMEDPNTPA